MKIKEFFNAYKKIIISGIVGFIIGVAITFSILGAFSFRSLRRADYKSAELTAELRVASEGLSVAQSTIEQCSKSASNITESLSNCNSDLSGIIKSLKEIRDAAFDMENSLSEYNQYCSNRDSNINN